MFSVGDYGTDLDGENLIDVLKALEEVEGPGKISCEFY